MTEPTEKTPASTTTSERPCFGCGHLHDPASPGRCWESACLPSCPEHPEGDKPFGYQPDRSEPSKAGAR